MSFTDPDLIARILVADDRNAFAELLRRHQSIVRALLRKLTCGRASLADDLAQETFLRVYRNLSSYRGTSRLSTWMCQIAYNVYLTDVGRGRRRAQLGENQVKESSTSSEGPTMLRQDLERAMVHLNEDEREAIALAFGQDLAHEEAAAIIGCPLGTLKSRIKRGLEKLEIGMKDWRQDQ